MIPPFNWDVWRARFPALEYIGDVVAGAFYTEAAMMFPGIMQRICDAAEQSVLLNLLTAHLVKLNAPGPNGQPSARGDLVGQLVSATKGSVTVSVQPGANPNAEWFMQTQYGAEFWQMTARQRMARYYPGPSPYLGVGPRVMPGWPSAIY